MPRPPSFYLPPERWGPPWLLDGGEAAHLSRVLRIREGRVVRLFNGCGGEGEFVVAKTGRVVELAPKSLRRVERPAARAWAAPGWNKASRRGLLLEKAVEFHAGGLLFWQSARSQGKTPSSPKDSWGDRLTAGAKQCGAAWLPELGVCPGGAAELVERTRAFDHRVLLWEDSGAARALGPDELARPGDTLYVLGPEGGLTDEEAAFFMDAGFAAVTLGDGILRWETAAMLALGLSWWAGSQRKHGGGW